MLLITFNQQQQNIKNIRHELYDFSSVSISDLSVIDRYVFNADIFSSHL